MAQVEPEVILPQVEDTTFVRPVGHRGTNVRVNARYSFTPIGFEVKVPSGPYLANSLVYYSLTHDKEQALSKIGIRGITYIKMEFNGNKITIHCQSHRVVTLFLNDAERYEELSDMITRNRSLFFRVQDAIFDQFINNEKTGQIKSAFELMNRSLPVFYVGSHFLEHAAFGSPSRQISVEESIYQEVAMDLGKDYQELIRIISGHLDRLEIQHDRNADDSILGNFRFNRRVQAYIVKDDGSLERPVIWRNAPRRSTGGILATLLRELLPCVPTNDDLEEEERISPKKEIKISGPFSPRKI